MANLQTFELVSPSALAQTAPLTTYITIATTATIRTGHKSLRPEFFGESVGPEFFEESARGLYQPAHHPKRKTRLARSYLINQREV